jgi:hypothetical protein
MRYTPYTEDQIKSLHVIKEGIYPFKVLEINNTDKNGVPMTDKNGNDLVNMKLLVWDSETDKQRIIYTYMSGDGAFAYKLRHFAITLGMLHEYETGTFDIMKTIDKSGYAHVIIRKGALKNDGSNEYWPDKNDVKDFVMKEGQNPESGLDDDIPF